MDFIKSKMFVHERPEAHYGVSYLFLYHPGGEQREVCFRLFVEEPEGDESF